MQAAQPLVGPTAPCSPEGAALWKAIFGNGRPVSVEIGPGRGEFLLHSASVHPERNFFAIERSRRRVREIEAKLERKNIANARILGGDAPCLLSLLPDACVASYHIQFPDPWWKRRHHRRRLFTAEFVAALRRTLLPGGTIEVVTDVPGYFQLAQQCLAADEELEPLRVDPAGVPVTAFARKAEARHAPLYRSTHRRRLR